MAVLFMIPMSMILSVQTVNVLTLRDTEGITQSRTWCLTPGLEGKVGYGFHVIYDQNVTQVRSNVLSPARTCERRTAVDVYLPVRQFSNNTCVYRGD